MANKKKLEEQAKVMKAKRTERGIQLIGVGVVIVLVVALAFAYLSNRKTATPDAGAVDAPQVISKQYDAYPPMTIDTSKQYFATFKMAKGGEFVIQLYADKAPITVNSFVFLAREGYYNGVTFHRVIDGFMAQGGDPTGTGGGGPGYSFEDEFNSDLVFDKEGVLAMANSGPNTNGSQFFITYGPTLHLNNLHTIFGQVVEGMDVVNSLTRRDPNQYPDYPGDAIESITITEQ